MASTGRATRQSAEERAALLEELLRARSLLFSEFEHKLKTSFAVIAGWSDMLTRQWDEMAEADRRDAVGWLHKKAAEVVDQANALLELTQDELASLDHERALVDVCAVVRDVAIAHQALAPNHTITCVGDDSTEVLLDAVALQQVLAQLVENAIKYSPDGGAITIRVEGRGSEVAVSVSDEGVGLPPDAEIDIWAPFVRGTSSDTIGPGTGIGLYVVRNLVHTMRGSVECGRNPAGKGATFTVVLPRV